MDAIKQLQEAIDHKQTELEQAQRQGNWEAAARIQYGEMRDLKAQLEQAEQKLRELQNDGRLAGEGRSDAGRNRAGRRRAGPACR